MAIIIELHNSRDDLDLSIKAPPISVFLELEISNKPNFNRDLLIDEIR